MNIIFESHRTLKGRQLSIRHECLLFYKIRDRISRLELGVQFNMISGACYSGAIAKDIVSQEIITRLSDLSLQKHSLIFLI